MRKLLLVLILQGIAFQIVAQSFPASWEGYWSGEVEIWGSGVQQGAFPMSLEIKPTDSLWTYIITYDHGRLPEPDIREYSLVILEDTLGHYAIDEHNSIVLDAYFMGGCHLFKTYPASMLIQARVSHVGHHSFGALK